MFSTPRVLLSRQTNFSAGLRLSYPLWDAETNHRVFGKSVGPHGAEFRLRVVLQGDVSAEDGMIVNLVEVKPLLNAVTTLVADRFLSEEVAFFREHRPTPENIALFLWREFPSRIGAGTLYRLHLEQLRRAEVELQARPFELTGKSISMKVSRSYEFAAAHRLHVPQLSEQENWKRFDKCCNAAGHGHNFQLHVWVEGEPDADSGFIILPSKLDAIVEEEVYARFDHKHLNEDCPEFADSGLVPTSENLALIIFQKLQARLLVAGYKLARVGLQETQKNYFEVEA